MKQAGFYGVVFLGAWLLGISVGHSRLFDREHADRTRIEKLEATIACLRHGPMQAGQPGCVR